MKHFTKTIGKLTLLGMFGLGAFGGYTFYTLSKSVPTITKDSLVSDASSNMYASNGKKIWSSSLTKRIYVKYKDLPQDYIKLLVSTEDRGFFKDSGLSAKGLINAGVSTVLEKLGHGTSRGGSTIDQQLIKLTAFSTSSRDRTISRKVKEMILAQQLNKHYSKQQILEWYVNKIYLGEGAYGAQTIAHVYYGKTLNQLNLSQLALLAGAGQAGSYYNLYDNPHAVMVRRNQVLKAGLENHAITKAQYKHALHTPIQYGLKKRYWEATKIAPIEKEHASFINGTLQSLSNEGYNLAKTPLQIHTTLDIKLDNEINDLFNKHPEFYQSKTQQAAMTITNPKTGYVLAQNGGRHQHNITSLNRAVTSNRSTGSSIKPLIDYGPAIEYLGLNTGSLISSSPYHYAGTTVVATNFGGASYGMVTVNRALVESMNTPAIRVLDMVGSAKSAAFANKIGIYSSKPFAASSALGIDQSTLNMAGAYGALANNGIYHKPSYIKTVTFADGSVKSMRPHGKRAMSKATSYIMNHVLQQVITNKNGTLHAGKVAKIHMAAKTGTVAYPQGANVPDDSAMDFWTCGYTKDLSIALWEGYDEPMKPNQFLYDNATITRRGKLWKYFVKRVTKGRDNSNWTRPKGVIGTGNSLQVAHPYKLPTLGNLNAPKLSKHLNLYDVLHVVESSQKRYQVPKNYKVGSWRKKYNKYVDKTRNQDDREFGSDD